MDEEIANVESCREIEIVLRGVKRKKKKKEILRQSRSRVLRCVTVCDVNVV